MNKKAFTLTEILGVVAILGLIMLIITPGIINRINAKKQSVSATQKAMLKEAVDMYVKDHSSDSSNCIAITELQKYGYLNDNYKDVANNTDITGTDKNGEACQP